MALRASSLQSTNTLAINREIGSQYDVILEVSKHLVGIDTLANEDINGLINSLNEAKDFTGITVVTGETPSWDATNKILTVPVEKGDAGENGRGITNIELTSTTGLTKTYTINYTDGTSSTFTVVNGANGTNGAAGKSTYQLWLDAGNEGTLNDFLAAMRGPVGPIGPVGVGVQGEKGDAGKDLTIEQIVYNNDGTFTWHFSDETTYTTPNLKGPKGDKGDVGLTGLQGTSVHHIKGTSTTDLEGDFASYGEIDTYTLYGDAAETINLGYFRVNNGLAKEGRVGLMYRSTYDTNNSGIVDDAEKLNGLTAQEIQASITDLYGQPNGIATLDGTGLIPAEQLPSYVDDVIEVNTYADLPVVGESSKIYVVIVDETSNGDTTSYRWTGTVYAVVSNTLNASDVKALYEANPDTNAYTDAEKNRVDIDTVLTTTAQTLPTAVNELDNRVASIEDNTTLAEYGITDAYTKTENDTLLALKVSNLEKGIANGIATLDINGKVVLDQIPDSVLGQLEYMGTWDLTTFPTATQKGQYWIASVSGNGYTVGDWAVWNGTAFDKVDNTDAVATVAGKTGNVVLTKSDVGLANVDNTADMDKPVSIAQQTALNLKANIASPTFTGIPVAPTASVGTNTTQLATTAFVIAELNKIEEW